MRFGIYETYNQNEYGGYQLSDSIELWELTNKQKETLNIAIYILDNKVSLRTAGKEFCIAKSTIHDRIHRDLRKISYELYQCVRSQLKLNKQKYFK